MTSSEDMGTGRVSVGPNVFSFDAVWWQERAIRLPQEERALRKHRQMTGDIFLSTGIQLSRDESSLPWRGGDLYIEGKVLGHGVREKIMTPAAWINAGGLAHQTFKNRGSVCARFPRDDVTSTFHLRTMRRSVCAICRWKSHIGFCPKRRDRAGQTSAHASKPNVI